VDGAGTPGPAQRSGDPVVIQPLRNRFRCDSYDVLPEDAVHDRRFHWLNFSFASRKGSTDQRFHHAVAVTEPAAGLAALHAPTQSSVSLLGQVLQEQGVHRALEPDVQMRDVALCNLILFIYRLSEWRNPPAQGLSRRIDVCPNLGDHKFETAIRRGPTVR
jgi:hypothetical protein